MDPETPEWKSLTIKHKGKCCECGKTLAIGATSLWNPSLHVVKCLDHKDHVDDASLQTSPNNIETNFGETDEPINFGTPGGSAKAQADRRIEARKERVIKRFPRAGKFILAITDDPQSTKAWERGAKGEIGAARELEKLSFTYNFKVLHDRLIPNSQANIDHIAITSAGIFVIDAKNYQGKIIIEYENGFLSKPNPILHIGGRNSMKLVSGVKMQVKIVKKILDSASIEMPVTGVLAFYRGNWELLSSIFPQEKIQGVFINNKGIDKIVTTQGIYTPEEIDRVLRLLASKLVPAS